MPVFILLVILFTPWLVNGYKFTQCDFESDYKCEAIHGVGVFIPPSSLLTMWFGHDS